MGVRFVPLIWSMCKTMSMEAAHRYGGHAGGAYRATHGEPRRAALLNFCRGIFRQQENQMAGITHEQAAGMPPAAQRLLGYSMSDTALGYSNGQDPALLLGEGGKALAEENKKRLAGMRGK